MVKSKPELSLYTAEQVRALDRIAVEEQGIAGITLMRRAAEACFECIHTNWQAVTRVTVFCGAGNNAGDGYILAGLLAQRGFSVEVLALGTSLKPDSDAQKAFEFCTTTDALVRQFESTCEISGELLVDALLGTGLKGEVRSEYLEAIEFINQSGLPVLSLDLPSGLCADSGSSLGGQVSASRTLTFVGKKRGLLTHEGIDAAGVVEFDDLNIPPEVYDRFDPAVAQLDIAVLSARVLPRRANSHKGKFGHLLVVGGDESMPGAVAMAAEAGLRVGAGLVTVVTRKQHLAPIIARRPELMVRTADDGGKQVKDLLEEVSCVVIGPGLGTSDWSRGLLDAVLQASTPMIVDADALNLLSQMHPVKRDDWILTPHPGEAGRLLTSTSSHIQEDRFRAVSDLQARYGGVALLKGAGTLIAAENSGKLEISLCPYGNPGMASAGMGDVLSGVIGGLLAQSHDLKFAAQFGACLHSKAADDCAQQFGENGLLASDLFPFIRKLINP